ncbi:MAG: STAS domain-containing protein [Zetaproteobacteria bacterium]|nr:STAS domain-containing protein [Zetaproteobacteria bacterium]
MSNNQGDENSAMGHDPLAWIASETETVAEIETVVKTAEPAVQAAVKNMVEEAEPSEGNIENAIALAEQAATGILIRLEGDVGIASVNILHEQLREALQQTSKVTIEGKDLAHVDTAVVQVLYAFVREAKKSEVEVQWQSVPESFLKTVAVLGLSEKMACA